MLELYDNPSRIRVRDKFFRLYLSRDQIDEIVSGIAGRIDHDYSGKTPLFLGILNGAFIFASDLLRKLQVQSEISFVKYSSYHGMASAETVNRLIGLNEKVNGRDVIILEDIVDTGLTMAKLLEDLKEYSPTSVKIACFCFKKAAFRENFSIDYCGLEIPKLFVVGYGLDYNGAGRNFPDIYQLDETV
ncbi:MAG: phosphoribosyltransferase family protein [Bacteroidetes bacterium]|nr:phosphoribosyltransferase family protein [Bacteroidota bacterium]